MPLPSCKLTNPLPSSNNHVTHYVTLIEYILKGNKFYYFMGLNSPFHPNNDVGLAIENGPEWKHS